MVGELMEQSTGYPQHRESKREDTRSPASNGPPSRLGLLPRINERTEKKKPNYESHLLMLLPCASHALIPTLAIDSCSYSDESYFQDFTSSG